MTVHTNREEWVADLGQRFSGALLTPDAPEYDDVRRLHNGLIDKRPAVIARCRNVQDVAEAVRAARLTGLPLAVRGGGHNVAGLASVDAGIMIDLSLMKGIAVDLDRRTARVEGGVLWRELNAVTQTHGLATTGGVVSTTGVAGLTLGGGLGWLMGKYGFALDNLISAEAVTADGEIVTASATSHADLFWALRGAGANFAVVSSFEFQLHPVGPMVMGGLIAHPLPAAPEVLRLFREVTADLPDEASLAAALTHAPDGSGAPIIVIVMCHCGSPEEAQPLAERLKGFGEPVVDAIGPLPYADLNQILDGGFPKGTRNYWKGRYLDTLGDDTIEVMTAAFARSPSPMSLMVIDHIHGAAARRRVSDTACAHRREGYSLLTISQWVDPADDGRNVAWAKDSYQRLRPGLRESGYLNYLDQDDMGDPVVAAYGENYPRLRELKRRYDPGNLFRVNHNIPV